MRIRAAENETVFLCTSDYPHHPLLGHFENPIKTRLKLAAISLLRK